MTNMINGVTVEYTAEELIQIEIDKAAAAADFLRFETEENRSLRNKLLLETDFWELPSHAPISSEKLVYRQALRDLTTQEEWPYLSADSWPTKP